MSKTKDKNISANQSTTKGLAPIQKTIAPNPYWPLAQVTDAMLGLRHPKSKH